MASWNRKEIEKQLKSAFKCFDKENLILMDKDGKNACDFYRADVVGARRFAQNHGGYPRSDIAEINEAASVQMQLSLLSQIEEVPVDESTSGLTDAEIMLGHRSKYMQTPSEMTSWLEGQLAIRDARRSNNGDVDSSRPSESNIEFGSGDSSVSDNG